jgi:hypothetical protein
MVARKQREDGKGWEQGLERFSPMVTGAVSIRKHDLLRDSAAFPDHFLPMYLHEEKGSVLMNGGSFSSVTFSNT